MKSSGKSDERELIAPLSPASKLHHSPQRALRFFQARSSSFDSTGRIDKFPPVRQLPYYH